MLLALFFFQYINLNDKLPHHIYLILHNKSIKMNFVIGSKLNVAGLK